MPSETDNRKDQTTATATELSEALFKGPVRFLDGARGMAQQDYECVAIPRFGYSWRRDNHQDKGRQFYTVDGKEVADLEEAARLLAAPPDVSSPAEIRRRSIEAFKSSPKIAGMTRALSDAECNVSAGPFGTVRSWMRRAGDAYHRGINAYADLSRKAGADFDDYRWLYEAKSGAHEAYRLVYLFRADRTADTDMVCALGTRCRDCPILTQIETAMERDRTNPSWPREIEDADIDAAKAWTCIAHVLHSHAHSHDGAFVENKRDRQLAVEDAERWAAIAAYEDEETNGG